MRKLLFTTLVLTTSICAQINVATTYNYLGEVTKTIGGDLVKVDVLSNPKLDPHFIVPKPSLLGKLHKEDLLIINGGQLEIGWLPPLLKGANNGKINAGQSGFLDVSGAVEMMDKPKSVSRAYGDVHPDGNPHFATDIRNIVPIAKLISLKLTRIDPSNEKIYNSNYETFKTKMESLTQKLATKHKSCEGKKVAEYHELFDYALKAYGVERVGTIEPLPGITPSSKHTLALINTIKQQNIKTILQDVYHEKKTAKFIADQTGDKVAIVPHDVGAVEGADTLESFYEMIADRLCQ